MTMISFRIEDGEAIAAQGWAERLGIDKSELLRDALHRHLVLLASQDDVDSWSNQPLTDDESALAQIGEWGPAEDWADWADATR